RERHRVLAHADRVATDLRSMHAGTGSLAAEWRPRRAGSLARKVTQTGPPTARRGSNAPAQWTGSGVPGGRTDSVGTWAHDRRTSAGTSHSLAGSGGP